MNEQARTNPELIEEISFLKQRIRELEQSESERKHAEDALQKSYALLKSLVESSKEVVIFALDRQYRYIAFNENHHQTMKRIWGVDIALGNSMLEYIKNPEDCLKAKNNFDRALSGESFTLVEAYGDTALDRRYYEDIYNPIIDGSGDVIGLTLFLTDITDRKQAEEALRKSEEKYRTLIEKIQDGIYILDSFGNFTFVNDVIVKRSGFPAEWFLGRSYLDVIIEEDRERVQRSFNAVMDGKTQLYDLSYPVKSGNLLHISTSTAPLFDGAKVIGLLGISRDITERKKMEEALRESEEKFRVLADSTPTAVMLYQDDRWTYANRAAEAICGYSAKELLAMNFWDFVHPDFKPLIQERGRTRQRGEETVNRYEFKIIAKDGAEKWVDLSGTATTLGGMPAGVISVLDITDRKRAEKELQAALVKRQELELIVNHSPAVVWLWKAAPGWPVEYVSDNLTLYGYTPDDFTSGRIAYVSIVHPDDLPRVGAEVEQYTHEGRSEFTQEYRILTKSGDIRWIDDRTWVRRGPDGSVTHYQGI